MDFDEKELERDPDCFEWRETCAEHAAHVSVNELLKWLEGEREDLETCKQELMNAEATVITIELELEGRGIDVPKPS